MGMVIAAITLGLTSFFRRMLVESLSEPLLLSVGSVAYVAFCTHCRLRLGTILF